MNPILKFDFIVDKANSRINVTREFAANLPAVWSAWTTAEILDQWWGPKPYRVQTKSLDFKEGGTWLYAMVSPQNESHWARADYQHIENHQRYVTLNFFCDEEGNVNKDFAPSEWTNNFSQNGDKTLVEIHIKYKSPEALEKIVQMGFKEGLTMCLNNLDELIAEEKI